MSDGSKSSLMVNGIVRVAQRPSGYAFTGPVRRSSGRTETRFAVELRSLAARSWRRDGCPRAPGTPQLKWGC
jgi:hypothetical protein